MGATASTPAPKPTLAPPSHGARATTATRTAAAARAQAHTRAAATRHRMAPSRLFGAEIYFLPIEGNITPELPNTEWLELLKVSGIG